MAWPAGAAGESPLFAPNSSISSQFCLKSVAASLLPVVLDNSNGDSVGRNERELTAVFFFFLPRLFYCAV